MDTSCTDRDLLVIEPIVFTVACPPAQRIAVGSGGQFCGTTFSAAGVDFQAAGVAAGRVLATWSESPAEAAAWEVLSVEAPGELTASVLRASRESVASPPPAQQNVNFAVISYAAQIQDVAVSLAEKLRLLQEAGGIKPANFCDSEQLRIATAYGALAEIFTGRAVHQADQDVNWAKARHYRQLFSTAQLQIRLAIDADADGIAEQTRTLGNVSLRRV